MVQEIDHHLLHLRAAGEEVREKRIDLAEVEFEKPGAEFPLRAGGFEDEDLAAGFQHAMKFPESRLQIGEVSERVADREELKRLIGQGHRLGPALDEGGVGFLPRHRHETGAGRQIQQIHPALIREVGPAGCRSFPASA